MDILKYSSVLDCIVRAGFGFGSLLNFALLYIKIQDQGNAKMIHGFWSLQMLWTVYSVPRF
jgi:hypothetical protein